MWPTWICSPHSVPFVWDKPCLRNLTVNLHVTAASVANARLADCMSLPCSIGLIMLAAIFCACKKERSETPDHCAESTRCQSGHLNPCSYAPLCTASMWEIPVWTPSQGHIQNAPDGCTASHSNRLRRTMSHSSVKWRGFTWNILKQSEKHLPPVSRCLTLSTNRTCRFSGASKDWMLLLGVFEAGQLWITSLACAGSVWLPHLSH